MERTKGTRLTDTQISELIAAGCSRWTKYGKDRLYVHSEFIGLSVTRYNTGNVSSAELNGERISNSYAKTLLGQLNGAYIDVNDSRISADPGVMEMIKKAIESI